MPDPRDPNEIPIFTVLRVKTGDLEVECRPVVPVLVSDAARIARALRDRVASELAGAPILAAPAAPPPAAKPPRAPRAKASKAPPTPPDTSALESARAAGLAVPPDPPPAPKPQEPFRDAGEAF